MYSISSENTPKLSGEILVPGDKSISHRALILGSMVSGRIEIKNLLESEDVIATANALKTLGVTIKKFKNKWEICGQGIGSFSGSNYLLNMGNSGTAARLLMGVVAGSDVEATFTGDESLSKRPMRKVILPLLKTGAMFKEPDKDTLPITLRGNKIPLPLTYKSPVSSAQIKSCILLSGLSSLGKTTVIEPSLSRDHTERMLKFLGANVETTQLQDMSWKVSVQGLPELKPLNINVPSDPSSAAFPIVSAIITPNSKIKVKNICVNKLRMGLFETLVEMGANIEVSNKREINGELIADISSSSSDLKGVKVPKSRVPSMIDEFPILSIAAAKAKGNTVMEGVEELRYKETDRIKAMCNGLQKAGVETIDDKDIMIVKGIGSNKFIEGGVEIHSKLDHRIAMSFLSLGLTSKKPIIVNDTETINSSFPNFLGVMNELGARLKYVN